MSEILFSDLVGKVIVSIDIDNDTTIETSDGKRYMLMHYQDCCERVEFHKQIGEASNILNEVITLAEEDSCDPDWADGMKYSDDSHTWSSFYLETSKGRLELWFLGESNGYYGESVSFVELH